MSETPENAQGNGTVSAKQEFRDEAIEFVKMIVWFLILFGILRIFVVEGYEVTGDSMEPTLCDRDRILVFKLSHKLSQFSLFSGIEPLEPGDVVVFDSQVESGKRYVKRLVAKGIREPQRNTASAQGHDGEPDQAKNVRVLLDNGTLYVNNKRQQEDYLPSRHSTSMEICETLLPPNTYFVLGDNRRVSKDSRSFGPIDDEYIIGKAVFRFWPLTRIGTL
ncbi:MAG TPA: signal peptidase I [Candidatus Hydrogenedentes bacterium]|nr:signal peptidase I [Candidatus Hydrogenedentota bacterium]